MPQIVRSQAKTKIKVVPRDGELEITLNININVDGSVVASSDEAEVTMLKKEDKEEASPLIPDFVSGKKLSFGKDTKEK